MLRQYILPVISDNYNEGCGVMVGNNFITAGHVIRQSLNPRIIWKGEYIPLPGSAVDIYGDNLEGLDVAVCSIPNVNSPLVLSDIIPAKGHVLMSYSWRRLGEEYVEYNAVVNGIKQGNYFAADTNELLRPGSSGSPVFLNGEIVGILCASNCNCDNTPCNPAWPLNLCVFLSSRVIIELMK